MRVLKVKKNPQVKLWKWKSLAQWGGFSNALCVERRGTTEAHARGYNIICINFL